MAGDIVTLWNYKAEHDLTCIAISRNGELVFAASTEGVLYCLEYSGHLFWIGNMEADICSLSLAEAVQCVLVGCRNGKVYVWSYQGHLLQILETSGAVNSLSSTQTTYRVALGSSEGILSLYDATAQLLWQRSLPGAIRQVSLSTDGTLLILNCEDQYIYCFDGLGNQRWRIHIQGHFWADALLSASASIILASSSDKYVYCFDRSGHLYWRHSFNTRVNCIALTTDGHLVAAGDSEQALWLWRQNGEPLCKVTLEEGVASVLAISHDGRFVVAGTSRQTLVVFDEQERLLWTQQLRVHVSAITMTPNGRIIATIASDRTLSLVENPLVVKEVEAWEAQRLLQKVRQQTSQNEHMGIAFWFDSFDQALRERHLEVCEQLVQELYQEGYHLQAEEWRWVGSREGTLWLYQGLRYHKQQQDVLAQQAYERSHQRQLDLKYLQGEGQAFIALSILDGNLSGYDAIFFSLQTAPPELLGNGEMLLLQRMKHVEEEEAYKVLLAARQHGYLTPLLVGLSSPLSALQTIAAATLAWLRPGPELDILLEMLLSAHWLVRWQATLMLSQHVRENTREFTERHELVQHAVLEHLVQEHDPLVCEALVTLLSALGDPIPLSILSVLLSDSDPDVRMITTKALGKIGTAPALALLQVVLDGRDFMGQSISETVREILH